MDSTYVYHDRKMMKWIPFNALLEQSSHITEMLRKREQKQMPTLSPDQYDYLNYKLEEALTFSSLVSITYFTNDFKFIEGKIELVDNYNKTITVSNTIISVHQITAIEII